MRKYIEIYALVVCFVSVLWFAVALTTFLNQVIRATYPQLTVPENTVPPAQILPAGNKSTVSANTADNQKAIYAQNLAKERQNGILQSIRELISLIVSSLVFLIHWRVFKKSSAVE